MYFHCGTQASGIAFSHNKLVANSFCHNTLYYNTVAIFYILLTSKHNILVYG